MYSLNPPVPGEVAALASDLAAEMPAARPRARGEHTLVGKRLATGDRADFQHLRNRAREALRGTDPFEAAVTGIDLFPEPDTGAGPVVYLDVESPGLLAVHDRLCEVIDPVAGFEGEGYVPHVTIARGGNFEVALDLAERDVDPIRWEVTDLVFWDAERSLEAGRLSLPM